MIDIFFLKPPIGEFFHPRTSVISVRDAEQADALLSTLREHGIPAAGRPSRRIGSVKQLIAHRDRPQLEFIPMKRLLGHATT
jgi:hypothetical protein